MVTRHFPRPARARASYSAMGRANPFAFCKSGWTGIPPTRYSKLQWGADKLQAWRGGAGMRRVVVWFLVIAAACCGTVPAFAETAPQADDVSHFLFFGGTDVWRNGAFAHAGFLWSNQGLNADGLVFKLLLNGGFYRYNSGGSEVTGRQVMGAAMPGWRWHREGLDVTVFAGLDVQDHRFTPDDLGNRLRGTHVGARGGFDAWYEPMHNAMVTASASLSTIGTSYWTRAAAGWRFFDAVWLGPEALACGDDTYQQFRVGAHVTSLRFWGREWSAGAGFATDTDGREGAYVRLGVLVRH